MSRKNKNNINDELTIQRLRKRIKELEREISRLRKYDNKHQNANKKTIWDEECYNNICMECGKGFIKEIHFRLRNGSSKKIIRCQNCGFMFRSKK